MVLRKNGKQLYDSVCELVGAHLHTLRLALVAKSKEMDCSSGELLGMVKTFWDDHTLSMRMISDVLMYLDRVYAKENHLPLIYDAGINLFRDNIIKYNNNELGECLSKFILQDLTANRNGLIVDIFLNKSIINMFEALSEDEATSESGENYYLEYFEKYYLDQTSIYYEATAINLFELNDASVYLMKVKELISNEVNKSALYLPMVTKPKLINLVESILITSRIDNVMKMTSGLRNWLSTDDSNNLKLLFSLLTRVKHYDGLKSQLKEIIVEQGLALSTKTSVEPEPKESKEKRKPISSSKKLTADAVCWIESCISLKNMYDKAIIYFNNDVNIQKIMDNAFIEFLNANKKFPEYLSLFIDDIVKKASNNSEEEIEENLNKSIIIFRFISDKDVFEKYYKNHLAKRLLKSSINDLERTIIEKLKAEQGSSSCKPLEDMYIDINTSIQVSKEFNENKFDIKLLNKSIWPNVQKDKKQQIDSVILPAELEEVQKSFEAFYKKYQSKRELEWAYNFGSIDIKVKFDKKPIELNMNLYCGTILLLFEEHEQLTFEEIEQLTRIQKPDLIRSLQSISVAPRTRVLIKQPMSKDINPGDVFKFNNSFTAPMSKVKILTITNKIETDSERSKTIEEVDENRKFEVEAAIVRTMKAKKTLSHNELTNETVRIITRFIPTPQLIKKRIEALLEREYLQRDTKDRNVYHYVA